MIIGVSENFYETKVRLIHFHQTDLRFVQPSFQLCMLDQFAHNTKFHVIGDAIDR